VVFIHGVVEEFHANLIIVMIHNIDVENLAFAISSVESLDVENLDDSSKDFEVLGEGSQSADRSELTHAKVFLVRSGNFWRALSH